MSEILSFVRECNVFFVLTIENGMPQGRPFGAIFEYGDKLYFSTATNKAVYRQLKDTGHSQIVALKNGTRNWIRIDGNTTECNDWTIKERILEESSILRQRFAGKNREYYAVFEMEVRHAELHTDTQVVDIV